MDLEFRQQQSFKLKLLILLYEESTICYLEWSISFRNIGFLYLHRCHFLNREGSTSKCSIGAIGV
jgi:hypothetical protein